MSKSKLPSAMGEGDASTSRAEPLLELLHGARSLAIVCHDDPDPDCLSSALGLKRLAARKGVDDVAITYGGGISHQQNWAMIDRLDMEVDTYDPRYIVEADLVAFVDQSVPGRNNPLPEQVEVDVVIDHHPADGVSGLYVDHRPSAGATATIIAEYYRDLGITPSERLATALLFGIRRETMDFMRGSTTLAEYSAAQYLHLFADMDAIQALSESLFSPETLDAIADVIDDRDCRGPCLVASAGRVPDKEAIPLAADYLLNLAGTSTTVVFGVTDEAVMVSARTLDPEVHIGTRLEGAFGDWGSAGGHWNMAGATLPLEAAPAAGGNPELAAVEDLITRLAFESLEDLV